MAASVLEYVNLKPKPVEGPVALSLPEARRSVSSYLTPPEIYETVVHMATEKAAYPWWKTFWLANLAGIYLSFGCTLVTFVASQTPSITESNPGIMNLLRGFLGLPAGLALIIICGAELVTTNFAYLAAGVYEGRCTILQLCKSWFWSFFGNLCGSLFYVWILDETYLIIPKGGMNKATVPMETSIMKTTENWGACVCRGFMCNYLVCLAAWQATAAQDISGKILGILFPIGIFEAVGFDHTVANMFFIPYGIKLGSGVTVRNYIAKSMIPVLIGNIISGAFFVAGSYAFCYGTLPQRISNFLGGMRGQKVVQTAYDDSAHGHNLPQGHKDPTLRVPGDNI